MEQMQPFYVGQEVECVNDNGFIYTAELVKGQRYIVQSVSKSCCNWQITIGIIKASPGYRCTSCGKNVNHFEMEQRFRADRFRAIAPAFEAVTFEKITEDHPVGVN